MKNHATAVRLLTAGLIVLAVTSAAQAQIPEHTPGTICATQSFWCWAYPAGVFGQECKCTLSDGSTVRGVYV